MAGIIEFCGELHTPVKTGTGDREIIQTAFDEADHFVSFTSRQDTVWTLLIPSEQFVLIIREPEKVTLFFYKRSGSSALRTKFIIYQLRLREEGFARDTVVPLVNIFVDISLLLHLHKGFLCTDLVLLICSANKLVIADIKIIPEIFERSRDLISILLRCLSSL